jgi:hypothetical protein
MPTNPVKVDSILAIDIGEINTRALLFDIVDGRYRFLASGTAPSTTNAPYHHLSEGVHLALEQLQAITGRTLLGLNEHVIIPESADGSGVDAVVATISAGPPLKVVAVGLLEDVSLESACRLAARTYAQVVETISLNDRRKPEERLDTILRARPDLIIAAGGTEGGASQSVLHLLESVGLACSLMPESQRPEVLFVGNQALQGEIRNLLESKTTLNFAPNIRPSPKMERLDAAQASLADSFRRVRARHLPGVQDLNLLSKGDMLPTAFAFGRIINFLSKIYTDKKGVLGIDLGTSAATVAGAFSGDLTLGVYPEYGMGTQLAEILNQYPLSDLTRWLPVDIPDGIVREVVMTRALYPGILPYSAEDAAIEQALARQLIRAAVRKTAGGFPPNNLTYGPSLLPWFEPVIASGSVFRHIPNLAQCMLVLLDALQPTGVTTLVLDQNHLTPALGAAASINPVLAVQVLESSTFLNLGTVISPVGDARPGTPVLHLRMTDETGIETSIDIKQGSLEVIPLPLGQTSRLHLQPLHRSDVGMGGSGRGGGLRVVGGALGLVVDARGRPLRLPGDASQRREMINKWLWTLGG